MLVKHEIKSQLAKLLATEDLIVENKKVETAEFNVHTRVLTLPRWEQASNNVYDSLVAHEVGHALFTPDVDWRETHDIPHVFVNVCEDVRIEKLMRRKYAGIAKTFYNGYHELSDNDFFDLADKDISDLNLADRINIYNKIGSFVDVSFSDAEKKILSLVESCETFEQVLDASQTLYEYCKDEVNSDDDESSEQVAEVEPTEDGTEEIEANDQGEETEEEEFQTPESSTQGSSQYDPVLEDFEDMDMGGQEGSEEPTVETAEALADKLKDLINLDGVENAYVELPKLNLDDVVVPNDAIHKVCNDSWEESIAYNKQFIDKKDFHSEANIFEDVDAEYVQFKREAQKEVNYLVKEFECKKAADSYARATTARTGVLDCSKLHTYKHNEDLFKKVTTLADGKNHGLVFILDWSGSMHTVLKDTVKQLYNLIWFCKKVNIPFEVYAFTQEYPLVRYDDERGEMSRITPYTPKNNMAQVPDWFSLMNFFSSKVNAKTLDDQLKNIWRVTSSIMGYGYHASHSGYANRYNFRTPLGLNLSGTPLNETLVALHQILPKFKKENKLQKVQCVILTDGEAQPLRYHKEVQRQWEDEPYLGTSYFSSNVFLRDRSIGKTYSFSKMVQYSDMTDILLENLRDKFQDINFVGIRILESRDAGQFVRRYTGYCELYEKVMKEWRKEKAFSLKNSGYHRYFGLSSKMLNTDAEFDPIHDATKAQIKRDFIKSLKGKKMNKKILSEFIELVA
ncbi:peptidase [Prochlorococcus phage P-SSM2]|uniref:Peptidase n=1 Tax=Prochlorococcus phage P-SSM2 TaxID=268746 RepID=Q58MK4_BPPRM|nr:peptidase [Prochlorococcus phage P-SSM2]AAX44528.1 peptidase [Prochlorococcus phage P-SSM2]ACY76029.1 conserved hypothetical protein [Prochlorococcus phage P-SSM2]